MYGPPPGPPPGPMGPPPPPNPYGPPGAPPPPPQFAYGMPQMPYMPMRTPGTAIASLICGIAGVPFSCCCMLISGPLAIAAIICGIVALSKVKAEPQVYKGKGLAIAGISLGG